MVCWDDVAMPNSEVAARPGELLLQSRPVHRGTGEPAVIIRRAQAHPAFVPPAEGLADVQLRAARRSLLPASLTQTSVSVLTAPLAP
jgi:hypothetical protein